MRTNEETPELAVRTMDTWDAFRAAAQLIKQHGDAAPFHASLRADELLGKGDLDGQVVWLRIIRAIKDLQNPNPPQGRTN